MSCPVNTDLSAGKLFDSFSARDQLIALAQLVATANGSTPTPAWEYSALGERQQWEAIGILMDEFATNGASDTNPNTLLAGAKDFQGVSQQDATTAIDQRICNLV